MKLRKSVKGISPVLSVLMMIAVAVAASLVTYAWVMGYLGFTTAKVGKAIQIQSIGNNTSGYLEIYVQNVGDSAVSLVGGQCLYINGVLNLAGASQTLNKGNTATITTTTTVVSGTSYVIRAVTQDGTFTEATKTFG
jgi:flagellin-like protein